MLYVYRDDITTSATLSDAGTNPWPFQSHTIAWLPHPHDAGSHLIYCFPWTHLLDPCTCMLQEQAKVDCASGSVWSNIIANSQRWALANIILVR
jgi:hypothetical protein